MTRPAASRCAVFLMAAITAQSLHAIDVVKENNTDALNLGSSWVGLGAPTSADVAVWDATVVGANTVNPGANLDWSGIRIGAPGGAVTINAQNYFAGGTPTQNSTTDIFTLANTFGAGDLVLLAGTTVTNGAPNGTFYIVNPTPTTFQISLTPGGVPINFGANNTAQTAAGPYAISLGSSGIDMSAATQNLTINSALKITADQTWNVANARTLFIGATAGFIGTNALTKAGAGTLYVNSANPSFSGAINLNGGTLALNRIGGTGSTSASIGTGQINMATGTTLRLDSGGNTFIGNNISISSGATVTLSSANQANGYSGLVTGDSTTTINIVNNAGQAFPLGGSGVAQFGSFNGTVDIATGNAIRFTSTGGANGNGGANATFNVNGNIYTRNAGGAGGVVLGGLTGSGTLSGQTNTTVGDVAYVIGGKNLNSTFAGTVINGTNGTASIRKVGTGTQTFTGSLVGNGSIVVNGGTALFSGTFTKTGTGVITVNTGGTLGGVGGILGGAATIASGGTLRPNTAPTDNTSRLSFSTSLTLASGSATTFDIDGSNFTGVTLSTAETLTFGGAAKINFVSTIDPGTYDLFNFTDSNTGNFASVDITQGLTSIGGLTLDTGVWSATYGDRSYSFSQLTGDLTVLVAVPEPSTWAAIFGAVGLAFAAGRRRRAA